MSKIKPSILALCIFLSFYRPGFCAIMPGLAWRTATGTVNTTGSQTELHWTQQWLTGLHPTQVLPWVFILNNVRDYPTKDIIFPTFKKIAKRSKFHRSYFVKNVNLFFFPFLSKGGCVSALGVSSARGLGFFASSWFNGPCDTFSQVAICQYNLPPPPPPGPWYCFWGKITHQFGMKKTKSFGKKDFYCNRPLLSYHRVIKTHTAYHN